MTSTLPLNSRKGFSLIELMVTVTIILIVMGGGIAGYLVFNEKQTVLESANILKAHLHKAQSQAKTGNLGSCAALSGYRVTVAGTPEVITIQERCIGGGVGTSETTTLPTGVTVTAVDVTYKVLHGGVVGAESSLNIDVAGSNRTYRFALSEGGEMSEGDWL